METKVESQPVGQKVEGYYISDTIIAPVLILISNLAGFLHLIPVFPQLLINSSCCVYLGVITCTKLVRSKENHLIQQSKKQDREKIGQKQALKFPIVASAFLFGLYLINKYAGPLIINVVLTTQFSIATILSTSNLLESNIKFPAQYLRVLKHVKPVKFLKSLLEIDDFDITYAKIICSILVSLPIILYCVTKYWALNNIFGLLFSIMAIRNVDLSSFKVGFILLWILFFYDIFWVYGTDVMVTVAKVLDIPIKLLFPYLNDAGEEKFSMLGLGDIVIPGIFVAISLKFDIDNCIPKKFSKVKQFTLPYFTTCFIGYIAGICATFAAMYIFNHPQPALLFLVPTCTLSVLVLAAIRGQIDKMFKYQSQPQPVKQEKKQQVKKN